MPRYRASVTIDAPQQRVYDHVADVNRHGEWSADPLQIADVDADHFTSIASSKGKTITAVIEVTERRPPGRFAFRATDLTGSWEHRFTLTPDGAGTRIEREISGKLSGAQLVLFWLVLLPIKKPNARRALERLKQRVEAG